MSTQQRWQYQIVDIPPKMFENQAANAQRVQEELNRQGQLGWELVSLLMLTSLAPVRATFKRPN